MSRYSKVERSIWCDSGFLALSAAAPNAQTLWLYLLTGPHNTSLPGLFRLRLSAVSEELGWEYGATCAVFAELEAAGMVRSDKRAGVVWLPKALKHNSPQSPNVVTGWRDEIRLIPDCALKTEALAPLRETIEALGPAFALAMARAFGEAPPMPSPNPSGKGSKESIGANQPKPLVGNDQSLRSKGTNSGAGAGAGAGDSDARAPESETPPVAQPPVVSCTTAQPVTAHPEAGEVLAALSLRATGDHELELHHVLRDVAARGRGVSLAAARRLAAHLAAHLRPGGDGKAWRPTLHHLRGKDGRWTLFLSLLAESETCGRCDVESGQKAPQNARKRHHALVALETAPTLSPEEEAQRRASLAALRQSINNGVSK